MPEPSYDELKKELELVRKQRDEYRDQVRDLLNKLCAFDPDEVEAELRDWQQNGSRCSVTLDDLIAELRSKLGPAA